MTKDFGESEANEMKARALGDTRHITSYVADWLEKNLLFADETVRRPVTRVNGRATAVMRRQWGINALKDRRASDLHHALDACVIAAATPAMVKKIVVPAEKRVCGGAQNALPRAVDEFQKRDRSALIRRPGGEDKGVRPYELHRGRTGRAEACFYIKKA